jgi:hypothetical protein
LFLPETFVSVLQEALRRSLQWLAQAVTDGAIFVENERKRIPRLPADAEPPEVKALRNVLVQLDSEVRFSWIPAAARATSASCILCLVRFWHWART